MSKEILPYTPPNPETVQKIIDCLENDLRFKIPKLEYPEETEIRELYRSEELTASLTQAGLTSKQKRLVRIALGAVCCHDREPEKLMTVGEIRKMTNKELLLQGRRGNRVGKKKLKILRAMFGKIPDEADIPDPAETLSFRDLNEKELNQIIALIMKDWQYVYKLPRIEINDEANPKRLRNIFNELRSRDFNRSEIGGVSIILNNVSEFKVGELKSMPDEEILEIKGVGFRGLVIIRMLIGYAQIEPDVPDFLKNRK